MEKFEITDYDLENEFSMYRNRKGFTKHQQIYGKNRTTPFFDFLNTCF